MSAVIEKIGEWQGLTWKGGRNQSFLRLLLQLLSEEEAPEHSTNGGGVVGQDSVRLRTLSVQTAEVMEAREVEILLGKVAALASACLGGDQEVEIVVHWKGAKPVEGSEAIRPHWYEQTGELWVGNELVKGFRYDAWNQRYLLCAFEEEHWLNQIDDPLPGKAGIDAKARLRETVKSLNRGQRPCRVRFSTTAAGTAVRWSLIQRKNE